MTAYLEPISQPKGLMVRMGYWYTRREFGRVPEPLSVFCARMPTAFTSFYGKIGKLDGKLTLPPELVTLVREQVATTNQCEFCMDSNRFAALNKVSIKPAKLDALPDFESSPEFTEAERAALRFATAVTRERRGDRELVTGLRTHFDERQVCELVWLVASEHLYNINNIALNIGSAGMCPASPNPSADAAWSRV